MHTSCIFTRRHTIYGQRFWKHSIMSRIVFSSYGGKLSGSLQIHFLNKLKADLFAWKLSTCADEVPERFPPPLCFFCTSKQWQYCPREPQLQQKCVFSSATPGRETERLNEKEHFEWKVWKPLFVCQVSGVVPASLHIHLSFLAMRCLSTPPNFLLSNL